MTRRTATRSRNDLAADVGRRAAQSSLGGKALVKNKQVSRQVSCFLAEGIFIAPLDIPCS